MRHRVLTVLLPLALSACLSAPRPPRGFSMDLWFVPLRDCSLAYRVHPRFLVEFMVLTPSAPRRPGILVSSPRLRHEIAQGRIYPNLELRVDGVPVHTGAAGEIDLAGGHSYAFYFDILLLLRRQPDGFNLEVVRGGRTLVHADLSGARPTFEALLRCAAGEPPAFPRH